MTPPNPRAWFGVAFFFAFVGVFLVRRYAPGVVSALAGDLPATAAAPVLWLMLTVVGVALQAAWWGVHHVASVRSGLRVRTHS